MPVAGSRAKSRLAEVTALLDVMKERGISTLKVGDIELTLTAPTSATPADDEEKPRILSAEERELKARLERRRIMLASSGQIVSRASSE